LLKDVLNGTVTLLKSILNNAGHLPQKPIAESDGHVISMLYSQPRGQKFNSYYNRIIYNYI